MPYICRLGINIRFVLAIAAAAFGSSFQHGYNTGVVNAPEKVLRNFINETTYIRTGEPMTETQVSVVWSIAVSIFCIGGMIGGCSTGFVANKFGRKGGLMMNNFFVIIASALEGFSKICHSYEMIIAGRFFIGINSGLNAGLVPMYLSEISPVHLRGAVGTVYQLVITVSILVSQVLGLESFLGTEDKWPILLGLTICPAIFQMATLPLCPESPKYILLNKGNEIEAERALSWFRGTNKVNEEMDEMRSEYETMKLVPTTTLKQMFTSPALRIPLIISLTVMVAQQFSGINAVIFFSTSIFEKAGFDLDVAQYATLGMGSVNVVITIISLFLVEKAGRKTLLLISLIGMCIDTVLLTICLALKDESQWISYFSIFLIIFFVIMFAIGLGSIPWFLVSELFSQSARPMAISIAVAVNWTANFIVGIGFPLLMIAMKSYVFIIFTVLLMFFVMFVYKKVPETRNLSIEEINALFQQRSCELSVEVNIPLNPNRTDC